MKTTAQTEANRRYYQRHRERLLRAAAEYRSENRERIRAACRRYAAEHKEERAAKGQRYYAANKARFRERAREWHRKNPHKKREYRAKRLATGAAFEATAAQERALREVFGGHCAYCLSAGADVVDHVQPVSRGGADTFDNYVLACRSCNASKKDLALLELLLSPRRVVTQRMVAR